MDDHVSALLPGLEEGIQPVEWMLRPPPLPRDTHGKAWILLLEATHRLLIDLSHDAAAQLGSQETRRALALLRRADLCRQSALLSMSAGMPEAERSLLGCLLAMDVSAALAMRLPDCPVRRALDFTQPELLDAMYRLANQMVLDGENDPQRMLGGCAEIMPGRPLIACHRHPYDGVCLPSGGEDAAIVRWAPLIMVSVIRAQSAVYQSAALRAKDAEHRGLFLELSLIAEQHQTLFFSLFPLCQPLDRLMEGACAAGYLYDSCARAAENADLESFFQGGRDQQRAHGRKIAALRTEEGSDVLPPTALPPPLILAPSKGYTRDTLDHIGTTLIRERQSPVGTLPRGADFFRYQRKMCAREGVLPSHAVIEKAIARYGSDYRFEIAPHPIEKLRDRTRDDTDIGR